MPDVEMYIDSARQNFAAMPSRRPAICAHVGRLMRWQNVCSPIPDIVHRPASGLQAALERWAPARRRKSDTPSSPALDHAPDQLLDQAIIAELRDMPPPTVSACCANS